MSDYTSSMKTYTSQKQYAERQQSKGLVRVTVWIPQNKRAELTQWAKERCDDYTQEQANGPKQNPQTSRPSTSTRSTAAQNPPANRSGRRTKRLAETA